MVTVDKIEIKRNCGVRPDDNAVYLGKLWCVEKGEPYDSVQFSIRELQKPYFWHTALCIKCGTSERKINRLVRGFAKTITGEEIHGYRQFLEDGEKWGWD